MTWTSVPDRSAAQHGGRRCAAALIGALVALVTIASAILVVPHGAVLDGHGGSAGVQGTQPPKPPKPPKTSDTPDAPDNSNPNLPPQSERATVYAGQLGYTPVEPPRYDDDQEVEHEENAAPRSTKQLRFHGGAVQTSPHIYLVLWGKSWLTRSGDPDGLASRLHYFYQGIGGSSVANVLTEYAGSTGRFTNPQGQYLGWLVDTTPVPVHPTRAQLAAAAARAAHQVRDVSYNTQYVIATPWGVLDKYTLASDACGWHDATDVGSKWITYTTLPYLPYYATLGGDCGAGRVTGSDLDGVTVVASHEYEESVNDPGLDAWYDADGSENADKCAWTNLRSVTLTNGYAFPVQTAWSNRFRAQYGNGCRYTQ